MKNYDYQRIAAAIQYLLSNNSVQPSLEEAAAHVNLSTFHFQKMFTIWAGVSPKKFLQYITLKSAKNMIRNAIPATQAETADQLGLSGTGRLHDLFIRIEGMTPGEYKNAGAGLSITYSIYDGLFGKYLVASTGKGISNLYFFDGEEADVISELKSMWSNAKITEGTDCHHCAVAALFENHNITPDLIRLHLKGTSFQLKVWEALLRIPQGSVATYGQIARNIEQSSASRAVGSAIGANAVAFLIPCHRVIKTLGGIGEFRWGPLRKHMMIGWEASQNQPVSGTLD